MGPNDGNKGENDGDNCEINSEKDATDEDDSSDYETQIEYLVTKRERRANAGSKMATLIESSSQDDEFYKSAYGGFNEDDADEIFKSPVHSDVDEVDSDFDRPEEEDEPISDTDNERTRLSRKKGYREPERGSRAELLAKNKKWAVARMGGPVVAANSVDAKTQAERLKEAEETEKANVESLRKYELFELERKKKREKNNGARKVPPPFISIRNDANGTIMIVPDFKSFSKPALKVSQLCAVTGRPAKYRDPRTGLPYSTPFAFKVIRDKYYKYLKTVKNVPEIDRYLEQYY